LLFVVCCLVGVQCRSAELEAASRARLQTLIQSYRAHCDSGSEVGVSSSGCSEVDTVSGIRVEALTNTAGYAAVPSSGDVGSADGGGSGFIGATLWALHGVRRIAEAMLSVASEPFHHPLVYSLPLLLHRSYLNLIREPEAMVGRCSQGLFLGAIVVLFYAPIAHTQVSVQNRIGCIFFISSICFIGVLNCIGKCTWCSVLAGWLTGWLDWRLAGWRGYCLSLYFNIYVICSDVSYRAKCVLQRVP